MAVGSDPMRSVDQIRQAMHRQPFSPFALHLVDGSVCMVQHPDFIAVPPGNRPREVAFFVEAGNRADGYETHWIDLSLILSVIVPADKATSRADPAGGGRRSPRRGRP
jgi:hypothetical protein